MNTKIGILTVLVACLYATQVQAFDRNTRPDSPKPLIDKTPWTEIIKIQLDKNSRKDGGKNNKDDLVAFLKDLPKGSDKNNYHNQDGEDDEDGDDRDHCRYKDCGKPPVNVPEPSILALLGTGLLLIGFRQRRKPR